MESAVAKLRNLLNARKGQFPAIAASSGLSYSWLCKFAAGKQANPTMASIEKLNAALDSIADDAAKAA